MQPHALSVFDFRPQFEPMSLRINRLSNVLISIQPTTSAFDFKPGAARDTDSTASCNFLLNDQCLRLQARSGAGHQRNCQPHLIARAYIFGVHTKPTG